MRIKRLTAATIAALTIAAATACGSTESVGGSGSGKVGSLDIIVPADPGGGWDETGREMERVIEDEKLVESATVTNKPGGGGTTGLAAMQAPKNPYTLMVMGYVMVGAVEVNKSSVTLDDVTPIAKLTEEQEVVVVPADSPYKTINDLLDDAKKKGQGVSIAGGSSGGADHILAGLMYQAAGIDGKDLNYVPYDGGGESIAALLGGKVDAGISGASEYRDQVASGELRALAVSGTEPVAGYDGVKPLSEQGVDVELTNWRGVVAAGNVSDADAKTLSTLIDKLHESQAWGTVLEEKDWTDSYLVGDEFGSYISEETTTVTGTLKEIGLVE